MQYDQLLDKTKFNFVLISIGKPEIGLKLCEHLGVANGQEYIYADPENECYTNLALNSGWDTMIRPATVSMVHCHMNNLDVSDNLLYWKLKIIVLRRHFGLRTGSLDRRAQ